MATMPHTSLLPQQFYIGLTAVTIICVQFLNLLMSVEPGSRAKAQWNDRETVALLDHLIENKTLGQGIKSPQWWASQDFQALQKQVDNG